MSRKTRPALVAAAAVALAILFVPWTRMTISGEGVLRPISVHHIEAPEDGTVAEVLVHEGSQVSAGAPILRLRSLAVEAGTARFAGQRQRFLKAASLAREQGAADVVQEKERRKHAAETALTNERAREGRLALRSPIPGLVLTHRPEDLEGRFVTAGTSLAEVGNGNTLIGELPVSERRLDELRIGADVNAFLPQRPMRSIWGRIVRISAATLDQPRTTTGAADPGVPPPRPDRFIAVAAFDNPGSAMRPGDIIKARIYSQRASYAARSWRVLRRWLQTVAW